MKPIYVLEIHFREMSQKYDNNNIEAEKGTPVNNKQNKPSLAKKAVHKFKQTPKRQKTEDEIIDSRIAIKKRLLDVAHAFEDDEDVLLNGDDDFEKFLHRRQQYDKIRDSVFDLEYNLRASSVVFEDSEFNDNIEDIVNTIQDPIIIWQTDLQPLNDKLMAFINNPGGFSADYLIPEFKDVRRMLKEILEKGDCPLYERYVPKEGTEQFDDYIAKIISDVKEKILAKRTQKFIENWEEEFRDGLQRQGKTEEKNEKYEEIDRKFNEPGPSTSNAFAQELKILKEEGKLGEGEEPTGEDVDDLENDDLQSEVATSEASTSQDEEDINDEEMEIIELNSDSEKEEQMDETMDTDKVEKSLKSITTNESDHNYAVHPLDLDDSLDPDVSIATGESALSPPISPTEPAQQNEVIEKSANVGDEKDNDDIICIE